MLPTESFRKAASTRGSRASSQSSTFLTPTVSDLSNHSPPPRPESEDYISAGESRFRHRKAHRSRRVRRLNNSENIASTLESREANIGALPGLLDSQAAAGSRFDPFFDELRTLNIGSVARIDSAPGDPIGRKAILRKPSSSIYSERNKTKHTSVGNLREISQSTKNDGPAFAIIRRISDAMAAAFYLPQTKHCDPTRNEEDRLIPSDSNNTSSRNVQSVRTTSARRDSLQEQSKIPTSISVRKASDAYDMLARTITRTQTKPQRRSATGIAREPTRLHPPSVELVAFYSEHSQEVVSQGNPSLSDVGTMASPMVGQKLNPRGRADSVKFTNQYGEIANCAITFADVHVAPGTFSVDSLSRKASMATDDIPQRMSTVQFRSRNSVHEIIWREDETVSGSSISCSSNGSSSPNQTTQFMTIADASSPNSDSPNAGSMLERSNTNIPFIDAGVRQVLGEPQESLSQFTWDKPASTV